MQKVGGSRQVSARGSAGISLAMVTAMLTALVFLGTALVSLANNNMMRSRLANESYQALALAEVGVQRARSIAQVVPRWAVTGTPKTLSKEFTVEGFKGSYSVTVTPTNTQAPGGYPLAQVVSTGTVKGTSRTITAQIYVQPPEFLKPALSIYDSITGQGPLVSEGDVYASGTVNLTGSLCIKGNLIAHKYLAQGGGNSKAKNQGRDPKEKDPPPKCDKSTHTVTGTIITDFVAHHNDNPEPYRQRPINPASWYRWAQKILWNEVYGRPVPDTSALQFSTVLAAAASPDYPYGVVYFVDGDFTIPDSSNAHKFRGYATIVVNGTLYVEAKKLEYSPPDQAEKSGKSNHLVLISLGGVAFSPESKSLDALIYTYDDGEAPASADAGKVWKQAPPKGDTTDLADLKMTGSLAAGTIPLNWSLEIANTGTQLVTGPAPSIPGMQSVLYSWELGLPDDRTLKRKWGIN